MSVIVRSFVILLMLSFSFIVQAESRLEGISSSVGESSFKWFSKDEEPVEEEAEEVQEPVKQESNQQPYQIVDKEAGCVKERVYTLDVENPDQYERLEDFPYTYECVIPH